MKESVGLKRSLGLWLLVFYGLGNILGAGIYVLVGKVAGEAGYFAPLSFMLAAFVAAFTAFTYAELSVRFPVSAGEAVYLQKGFDQVWLSKLGGILIAITGMLSASTIIRGFTGYLQVFIPQPDWVLILGSLLLLCLITIWGISQSVKIAAAFTVLEIAGLMIIIFVGGDKLSEIPDVLSNLPSLGNIQIWPGIFLGAFLAFFAFIGFEDMVNVAEEVKNPEKNMPRAIIIALIVSTVLYALVSVVAVVNLSPEALSASKAPLADIYRSATGREPVVITFISLFAVVNGALIQMIMSSRILYGMSNKGWLPSAFSTVNTRTQTPMIATIFVAFSISILAIWFPVEKLAQSTSYLILIVFFLINIALINIKKHYPLPEGAQAYPVAIPVIGALGSLFLLAAQVWSSV